MKKIPLVIISFTILMLILGGCSDVFSGKPDSDHLTQGIVIPEGFGAVRVNVTTDNARTAMPDEVSSLEYVYSFTRFTTGNENGQPYEPTPTADYNLFIIEYGIYILKINARIKNSNELIAEGEREFTVDRGTIEVPVALRPIEGTGTFSFTVNAPTGASVKTFALFNPLDDTEIDNLFSRLDKHNSGGSSFSINTPYSDVSVAAGYYLLKMTLEYIEPDGSIQYAGKSEVVHIYKNLTTGPRTYNFTNEDFVISILVNNTRDDGMPGSLRYALENAKNGKIINVMLPKGSVIKLNNSLKINEKNITLEGNGVTITKVYPWSDESEQQLLRIIGDSITGDVTIRRIHFKDGRNDTKTGGAIYCDTSQSVFVESCIFSGNTAGSGGAIFKSSYGTMTVKGCTFYQNSATNFGGAIQNSGSLTLTGNLFYENYAEYNPVIANSGASISLNSNGYNVVFNQSDTGLLAADGCIDYQLSSNNLPFSPKTFRLLGNSGAAANIPNDIIGKTDFYGEPINKSLNYAGAVQSLAKTPEGGNIGFYLKLDYNTEQGDIIVTPPSEDFIFTENSSITLTAIPKEGYKFINWRIPDPDFNNPLTISINNNTASIINNTVIYAGFEVK